MEVLTAQQLSEWMDYYGREPWGFPIEDTRAAMQMDVAAKVAGSKETSVATFSLAQQLQDGPPKADGTPSDNALLRKLAQFLPPPPLPTE